MEMRKANQWGLPSAEKAARWLILTGPSPESPESLLSDQRGGGTDGNLRGEGRLQVSVAEVCVAALDRPPGLSFGGVLSIKGITKVSGDASLLVSLTQIFSLNVADR